MSELSLALNEEMPKSPTGSLLLDENDGLQKHLLSS